MKRILLIAVVLTGLVIPAVDGYAGHRHGRRYCAPYGGARMYAGRSSTFSSWSSSTYGRTSAYRTYSYAGQPYAGQPYAGYSNAGYGAYGSSYPYAGYGAYGRSYPYTGYGAYGGSYYPSAQRGVTFYPGGVYAPSVGRNW